MTLSVADPNLLGAFLAAERQTESGGDYTAYNAAGGASGAYQFIQSTWTSEADAAGYSQYAGGPASAAPPSVQDAVAAHMAQGYFNQFHNWEYVAQSWYYPAWAGNAAYQNSVPYPSAGNTLTIGEYGAKVWQAMGGIPANTPAPKATGKSTPASSAASPSGADASLLSSLSSATTGGIPDKAPTLSLGWNPFSDAASAIAFVGEFTVWSFFVIAVFLAGVILMVLGIVMLVLVLTEPVAGPILELFGIGKLTKGLGSAAQKAVRSAGRNSPSPSSSSPSSSSSGDLERYRSTRERQARAETGRRQDSERRAERQKEIRNRERRGERRRAREREHAAGLRMQEREHAASTRRYGGGAGGSSFGF